MDRGFSRISNRYFFTSMSLENDVNDGQTSIDRDTKNNGMIFNRSHNNELYNEKLITK